MVAALEEEEAGMPEVAVLGIDLGKSSCSVAGLSAEGRVVFRRRVARDGIAALLTKRPPCVVAMEACCGAHHVGRGAAALGHQVRLMPPEYVRPYVKAQKNDDRDAEAIAEAATRPTMRFVPLKAEAQLDVQALHRARERLVGERHKKLREPIVGRKVLRLANPKAIVETAVPELRIVEQELWDGAQARLAAEAAPATTESHPAFWERRRPRHLLSEKVVCGCCGRTFTSLGKDYLGCSAARNGHGCRNTRRIRRPQLEAQVLEALAARLMHPELVKRFCASFIAAWNKRRAEAAGESAGREQELRAVERKLANLVEAIADGLKAPDLPVKLDQLHARRDALRAEIGREMPPAPALHPNIAEVYAAQVARLREALTAEGNPAALEAARALVDRVIVSPGDGPEGPPGIELVGRLMEMLQAGAAFRPSELDTAGDIVASMSTSSTKEDTGA